VPLRRYNRAAVASNPAHLGTPVSVSHASRPLARRAAAVLMAGLIAFVSAGTPASASSAANYAVAQAGQVLYEYEALLHQTVKPSNNFMEICGNKSVCQVGWFYRYVNGPMADFTIYTFVFSHFGPSSFHLMPEWFEFQPDAYPPGPAYAPGNNPTPVTVNGRYVACDPGNNVFLVRYSSAVGAGQMGCLAPAMPGKTEPVYNLREVRHEVSSAGQLLAEYEELVRAMFGPEVLLCEGLKPASASPCRIGWFYAERKAPGGLLPYVLFTYAFSVRGVSPFHVMPSWFRVTPGSFGNYPSPELINGRYVACNRTGTVFLIDFGDDVGPGGLACMPA